MEAELKIILGEYVTWGHPSRKRNVNRSTISIYQNGPGTLQANSVNLSFCLQETVSCNFSLAVDHSPKSAVFFFFFFLSSIQFGILARPGTQHFSGKELNLLLFVNKVQLSSPHTSFFQGGSNETEAIRQYLPLLFTAKSNIEDLTYGY